MVLILYRGGATINIAGVGEGWWERWGKGRGGRGRIGLTIKSHPSFAITVFFEHVLPAKLIPRERVQLNTKKYHNSS